MKKRFKSFRKNVSKKKRPKKRTRDQLEEHVVGTMNEKTWHEVTEKRLVADFLSMVERVGWDRAVVWLKRMGCDVSGAHAVQDSSILE